MCVLLLVRYRWNATAIAANQFQLYHRRPLGLIGPPPPPSFVGAASLLNGSTTKGGMVVSGSGSLGFDFGAECAGWLEFASGDLAEVLGAAVSVSMSTSEFTLPQFTTPTRGNNQGNCTASVTPLGTTGRYRLVLNTELYEGLRYGWLHVQANNAALAGGDGAPVHFTVTEMVAVCQVLPINYADHAFEAAGPGQPASSMGIRTDMGTDTDTDTGPSAVPGGAQALEEVWYTAMYTTRVDLLPGGFGSILMDRGDRISWTGDAHLAQKAALAGFGGDQGSAMVRDNTVRTQGSDNGIISYDLYFILSAVDYFMHTNDSQTFQGWAAIIEHKFATSTSFWAAAYTHQSFCGSDDRIGADFENSPPSEQEKTRYYKMLSIQAVREYARAVALCGVACAASMRAAAASLEAEFTGYFERERAMLSTTYGMHAAAGAVMTGLTTPKEEQAVFDALLSNPAHICSFSPFNTYFILKAVSRLRLVGGRQQAMQAALGMVHRCYHGMNQLGATTYWETFSPEWVGLFEYGDPTPNSQTGYMSHCHPWASGAAPWLTHTVLGLQPSAPGWANFTATPFLDPQAPNLLSSIRGVQMLRGARQIKAAFACNGSSSLAVPPLTAASVVALPLCGRDAVALAINGKQVSPANLEHGNNSLIVRDLGPGIYEFLVTTKARAQAMAHAVQEPAPSYRDRFIGADYTTGGDWKTRYGTDGHVFWSWHAPLVNDQQLPSFVSAVHTSCPFTGVSGKASAPNWVSPSSPCSADRRALQSSVTATSPAGGSSYGSSGGARDSKGASCRGLGGILGGTTATIDVMPTAAAASGRVNISAYFVDFERVGRRFAVELREYQTLQLAAPTQYVSNATEGVFLTWEVQQLPVRLRLMQVAGALPNNNNLLAFSALLFGTARHPLPLKHTV